MGSHTFRAIFPASFLPPLMPPGFRAGTITAIFVSGHLMVPRLTLIPFTPTDKGQSLSKGTFVVQLRKLGSMGAVRFQVCPAERVGIPLSKERCTSQEHGPHTKRGRFASAAAWGPWWEQRDKKLGWRWSQTAENGEALSPGEPGKGAHRAVPEEGGSGVGAQRTRSPRKPGRAWRCLLCAAQARA